MTLKSKTSSLHILEKEIIQKDPTTGEETLVRQEFVRKVSRDNFIQTYIEGIKSMLELTSKTDIRVLIALWGRAEWSTNRLVLIKSVKEEIASELGYKNYKVIDNSIQSLLKKKILIKKGRSSYYLDPNLFFRGTTQDRIKAVEIVYKLNVID